MGFQWLLSWLLHKWRRLSVTNYSSENNLPTFRLNAPVTFRPDDDRRIQSKRRQVIFIYMCGLFAFSLIYSMFSMQAGGLVLR